MTVTYGSVCSGIEAATVAWHPLGWQPQFFSEIEAAPRAVLAHHYPRVPLHGDFTTIQDGQYGAVDLLVGGTPCQSFSVAGLRGGLADDRGNLALQYLRLAQRLRPRWLVWENVPGVLSSAGGRDFGAILGGMGELGYGVAYRVLDAQYIRVDGFGRAVPQRRRRVFVVGHLGDWRRAAAVLFERACLRGDLAPSRSAGEVVAPTISARPTGGGGLGTDFDCDGGLIASATAPTLDANYGRLQGCSGQDVNHGHGHLVAFDTTQITSAANRSSPKSGDPCHPLAAGAHPPAIAFGWQNSSTQGISASSEHSPMLDKSKTPAVALFDDPRRFSPLHGGFEHGGVHPTLESTNPKQFLTQGWAVRRLTPIECERLQGFPDGYTSVPWRGGLLSDGPRYKCLGNSMAVNAMRWIGRRIEAVEGLPNVATLMAAE